jgi:hypothetical protein
MEVWEGTTTRKSEILSWLPVQWAELVHLGELDKPVVGLAQMRKTTLGLAAVVDIYLETRSMVVVAEALADT